MNGRSGCPTRLQRASEDGTRAVGGPIGRGTCSIGLTGGASRGLTQAAPPHNHRRSHMARRRQIPPPHTSDVLKALTHPAREAILAYMLEHTEPISPSELVEVLPE